jgi:hypothetical protein
MRTSILASIVAFGTAIAVPALAQQSTGSSSQQRVQDEADKGIKTRNSGESGYVGEQQRPGASSHIPGCDQTTTGASSATAPPEKTGGVSVSEQEKKPASDSSTGEPGGKAR